ncbi:MAG: phosphoribosyl-ATP diphosphatase [Zoogloeaceae bacterium]|jgi:phosphoribosyl-ATP pyrophosphohydrolase|nr:phosphoribosyl-ATP diphosphatase [Zoogloeaceae bacterium]
MNAPDILERLAETFAERKTADPEVSYAARLLRAGPDAILKKIGEETAELIMASKDGAREAVIHETADAIFHILLLLSFHDLSIADVRRELERREGISGIAEKASRRQERVPPRAGDTPGKEESAGARALLRRTGA